MDVELTDETRKTLKLIDDRLGLENFFEAAMRFPHENRQAPENEQAVIEEVQKIGQSCVDRLILWADAEEDMGIHMDVFAELHGELMEW